jgi:hypothetical protein
MVTARAGRDGKLERVFGTFHSLLAELQEAIIVAAKRGASKIKKSHDVALTAPKAALLKKRRDCTHEENSYNSRGVHHCNEVLGAVSFSSLLDYC